MKHFKHKNVTMITKIFRKYYIEINIIIVSLISVYWELYARK